MLALISEEFPQDVRIVYRHFPLLSIHDKAALASQAAEAAGVQGEFWQMHDLLYTNQGDWQDLSPDDFQQWISEKAADLGLDQDQFLNDMNSDEIVASAQAAWDKGAEIGLPGTPFLILNGQVWPQNLPMNHGNIAAIIKLELLEQQQFSECPPMTIDPAQKYNATLHTEKGDIVVELFADKAPMAVNNFIFLAQNGWYDGVTFHRVLEGFVAQAGDPTGTGYGSPGYAFANELSPELTFDQEGLLAMANSGPDSNGAQFFITYAPAPNLDGGYTIFGKVIDGMDVVDSLTLRDPSVSLDLPPGDEIYSVEIATVK